MSNEVTATNAYGDGFDVAEPVNGNLIRGALLRFKDDAFLVGGVDHLPEDVTRFTVTSMTTLWTRWENEKPTHRVTLPGQQHPRRDELGDLDEKLWPKNKDGVRADPWNDTRHVTMVHDDSAAVFTFSTSTTGGRIGVAELKDAIALRRRVRPGCFPVVELDTKTMKTKYGDRLRPYFRIVGWHEPEVQAEAPAPAPREVVKTLAGVDAEISGADLMNDQIPFAPEVR
jgi:hypothetical protein